MIRLCFLIPIALAMLPLAPLHAQDAVDKAAITQELDGVLQRWEAAFNGHDAQAIALTFAEQCDVEHNFEKLPNREAIEQQTAEYFRKNPQVQTELVDVKREILSPTAVVESGTWKEWNHTQPGLAKQGSYCSTMVKSNGKWEVVQERAFSNTNVFPSFFRHVIGGTWHEQTALQADDSYQWILSQKFIQFTSQAGDTQAFGIIGADPRSGELTWWVFRNDGSLDISRPALENPHPDQHLASIKGLSGKTDITMQITLQGDDESRIVAQGKINGVAMNGQTDWKRNKQIADHTWLHSKPPAKVPESMSYFQALQGAKWISSELDGVPGVGGSQGGWILDGKFFLVSASFNGADNSSWSHLVVIGPDPETKQMTAGWEFSSDGVISEFQLTPDGKTVTGKSFGGTSGTVGFSGQFKLTGGILDYSAHLKAEGQSVATPYRWVFRDAQLH